MRYGTLTIAFGTTIAFVMSLGLAQDQKSSIDRSLFELGPSKRTIKYFSKSGKSSSQTTVPQTTQKSPSTSTGSSTFEGFNRKLLQRSNTTPSRYRRTTSPTTKSQFPATSQQKQIDPFLQQTGHQQVRKVEQKPTFRRIPIGSTNQSTAKLPAIRKSKNVIHAEYNNPTGKAARNQIRQIRATSKPNSTKKTLQTVRTPRVTVTRNYKKPTKPVASGTPHVTAKWVKKTDINVGQECRCDLIVKNESKFSSKDIIVEAFFPSSVRLTSAKPMPRQEEDHLAWSIQTLAAGEERIIEVRMIPSARGTLAIAANVRFTGSATASFSVEEPLLKVDVKGSKRVFVGDPAPQLVTISNPGSGIAHNVKLEALIPKGLEHTRGERLIMDVGALNPGESRTIRLALAAVSGGNQSVVIQVSGDSGLKQITKADITVIAPSLQLAIDGPSLRYKGRTAAYTVVVANDGGAATNNVRVSHKIPTGFTFISASQGGKYDSISRTISWFVGRLAPGKNAKLKLELKANQIGDQVHSVEAVSEHGVKTVVQSSTKIEGAASLVMVIADLHDPVEVGSETAYEIRVRNDGSKSATNVGISCELPAGVELKSAKGPSAHISEGGLVVFKSLGQIPPNETAIYRIIVRGTSEGNHRFRARLASDSIQEPLVIEELTKFYQD